MAKRPTVSGKTRLSGLLMLIATGAAVLLGTSTADAQDDASRAEVQFDIRYPDGALVDDAFICITAYNSAGGFLFGDTGVPASPTQTYSVPANTGLAFTIASCGADDTKFGATWHYGHVMERFWSIRVPRPITDSHRSSSALVLEPGETKVVPVVVGRASVAGTITGEPVQSCTIQAFGSSRWLGNEIETLAGHVRLSHEESDYAMTLPDGEYRFEVFCFNPRVNVNWPADGSYVTLEHGEDLDLDFDFAGREPEEGTLVLARRDAQDNNVPFCTDTIDADDGSVISAGYPTTQVVAGIWVPKGERRKLRVRDCLGIGFDDVWYPNSPTSTAADTFTSDGTEVEIYLPIEVALPPDLATCNGQAVTHILTRDDDVFVGTPGVDVVLGLGGNDSITGLGGNDSLCAGAGDDRIFGNAGADWIDAGPGNDWVGAGWGNDWVFGGTGRDFIRGFKHDDTIDGGDGDDKITGGWGNDVLRGGNGNDTLRAYFGADRLYGDQGNDTLVAGNGPDVLVGGWGETDRLFGNQGQDTCIDGGPQTLFSGCLTVNGEPA